MSLSSPGTFPGMKLDGIHHVTCITGDARANQDFYTGMLGLRRVKLTINQDSPSIRRDANGVVFLNLDDAALHHLCDAA
jgi:catechol 2,3-dioxygenase-like lactoylglutathione lyase family enzyme